MKSNLQQNIIRFSASVSVSFVLLIVVTPVLVAVVDVSVVIDADEVARGAIYGDFIEQNQIISRKVKQHTYIV